MQGGQRRDVGRELWCVLGPILSSFQSPQLPKPRLFPAPSDTVQSSPPGGALRFLCFSPDGKLALLPKARGTQGACVTHITADFTFSL